MDIGKPIREITIEPIEVPARTPERDPSVPTVPEPEKVPT